ncbi:MAG: LTA synthase family protein [Bacteroidota bacterium]
MSYLGSTPKTLRWVLQVGGIFLLLFTLFRLSVWVAFRPDGWSFVDALPSFMWGLRYDLRWIAGILLPITLFSIRAKWSPFYSALTKLIWTTYLALVTLVVFFFFSAGFGSFSYNQTPLDAGAMNFVEDFRISITMIWETYPLLWMLAGLIVAVWLLRWMYHRVHWQVVSRTDGKGIAHQRAYFLIASLLLALLIHGSFTARPLRRDDCFQLPSSFAAYLAVNPLQNFATTWRLRQVPELDIPTVRRAMPVVRKWMGLSNVRGEGLRRLVAPRSDAWESKPNIVLVQCESFSMYKSSMSGNALNATPFFDSLSRQGIFFDHCFAPHFSTARALFAILSGIPDVQFYRFSSRNPATVSQRMLIDQLEGYSKHYFLSGSPEFNNFEGILANIRGLQMHTGDFFKGERLNVWGVSDRDLLLQSLDEMQKQSGPFFAYIQTAGNHRPFQKSIPSDDSLFRRVEFPIDTLLKYGYESNDELNAFRYSDHAIRQFMEAARTRPFFANTVFVFVGDHGMAGNARSVYPPLWTEQRLTDQHVPLLFYAPHLLEPKRRSEVVSQIDILPTLFGRLNQSFEHATLGRDLLAPDKKNDYAFLTNTADRIGMITNDFYFTRQVNSNEELLIPLRSSSDLLSKPVQDSVRAELSKITQAYADVARFLLFHNKKD